MGIRSCNNCGETADAAKAFCPGCGSPLEAEQQRIENSEFEASGNTIQFSQTAFNMVLSDMGLNISETPDKPLNPVTKIPIQPVVKPAVALPKSEPKKNSYVIWIVVGSAALLLLFAFAIIAGGVAFYFYTKPT